MTETLGHFQMRIALTPIGNGVHPDTVAGLVNDRIEQICRMMEWTRLERESILQTIAEYTTGTVSILAGDTAGAGVGTTFTDAMTGRLIRLANRLEYYTFTYVSATSFTIDRGYEDTEDLTDGSFRIWQPFYELPVELESIKSLRNLTLGGDLDEEGREYLNRFSPTRYEPGSPRVYVPAEDSPNGQPQIELYPGPITAEGLPMRWRMRPPLFNLAANSNSHLAEFPSWISIPAVFAGVKAGLYADAGKGAMAASEEKKFEQNVAAMMAEDARRRPIGSMQSADRYRIHRVRRTTRRHGESDIVNWNDAS